MARDETIALQGESRLFYYRQDDLTHTPQFGGLVGAQVVDGLSKNFGDLNAVTVPDNAVHNKFNIVRKTRGAPELGEITISEYIKRNVRSVCEEISKAPCDYVFLVPLGNCSRPDDLDQWDSVYVVIGANITSYEPGTLGQFDASDPINPTGTFSHEDFDRIFLVRAGEKADALVLAEVLKVIYADALSCGSCAPYSSGCDAQYALTAVNSGSPGLSSQLVFATNGTDYTKNDIAALGGLAGSDMNAVGKYLVVVSEAAGGHVYALKSNPASDAWTLVTTGYQAGGSPRVIFALAPQLVYIGGAGGYIYKSSDITSSVTVAHDASLTTQNCNDIHAEGEWVLSGHNSNTLLFSSNRGVSWSLITGPVVGANVTAVWVRNATQWYVGMSDGTLWYTVDGGSNWNQRSLPDQANITAIFDIQFSPDFAEIGALAVQKTATAAIYRTYTGGRQWSYLEPEIVNLGTSPERYRSVALCGTDKIAAGGKKAGSTDGVLVEAS